MGGAIAGILWGIRKEINNNYLKSQKIIVACKKSGLIAHKKNGTIHFVGVSKGNLPSAKWATNKIDLVKYHPYGGFEMRIYEAVGKEAISQKNDKATIYAYGLAIKFSPLSYHLYDKLIRIYGRRKEYNKVLELLTVALLNVEKMQLSKRLRKRAKKEFTMRIERTKKRSLFS